MRPKLLIIPWDAESVRGEKRVLRATKHERRLILYLGVAAYCYNAFHGSSVSSIRSARIFALANDSKCGLVTIGSVEIIDTLTATSRR